MRIERDSFRDIEVAADALWGAQTQRSLLHFRISSEQMPNALVLALAQVKRTCALVNGELALMDSAQVSALVQAANEALTSMHDNAFPLSVWQTGSGTQTNINMNDVLANRASELMGGVRGIGRSVQPNHHVNRGQSSIDIFPTAMHVVAPDARYSPVAGA